MIKVLITGANGLLGQKLVHRLSGRKDLSLIATAIGANRLSNQDDYLYKELDVTQSGQVNDVIGSTSPDVIIHAAAMTNVDACESARKECRRLNVDAVEILGKACENNSIHLVHLSTDFIFDGKNGPYNETAAAAPISFYGQSKLDAEAIVQNLTCSWAILRTILVYGITERMSRSNVVLWVKSSLEAGKQITVVNDQFRTPTFAEDLAQGCELAAVKKASGIYNIAGPDFMSIYELALRVATYFRLNKDLIIPVSSDTLSQPAPRPPRTGLLIDKARRELGYHPMSFEESLAVMEMQMAKEKAP